MGIRRQLAITTSKKAGPEDNYYLFDLIICSQFVVVLSSPHAPIITAPLTSTFPKKLNLCRHISTSHIRPMYDIIIIIIRPHHPGNQSIRSKVNEFHLSPPIMHT